MDVNDLNKAIEGAKGGFVRLSFQRTPQGRLALKNLLRAGAQPSPQDRNEADNVRDVGWGSKATFSLKLDMVEQNVLNQSARDIVSVG